MIVSDDKSNLEMPQANKLELKTIAVKQQDFTKLEFEYQDPYSKLV